MRIGLAAQRNDGKSPPARVRKFAPRVDGLEPRLALSTAAPDVDVSAARTADSKSVTFEYDVNTPNLAPTLTFGVYRSADAVYDAGDSAIGSVSLATTSVGRSTLDDAGQPAAAAGHHTLTLPIDGGLSIIPDRPYVLVVANPASAIGAGDAAARTGVIHTHSIAVVTHGGIQYKKDDTLGPVWERAMAQQLKQQGYNSVIKYVWAGQSRTPGKAKEQGAKLDRILNKVASQFPAGDPVNVHFIGHSEGAIVVSQAAMLLQVKEAPGIASGYIHMTMLDPHAANNHAPGYQYSVKGGAVGRFAKSAIRLFQWDAQDPVASVPPNVDQADVFWQHTQVSAANTNSGIYNLWGQVPVRGNATYYDITGPGISHSGDFGVPNWYRINVVPSLHDGGSFVNPDVLTGSRVLGSGEVAAKWLSTSKSARPSFSGTAAPGATITLFAARRGSYGWERVGESKVDASGHWTASPRALPDGRFRFAVRSAVPAFPGHPGVAVTPRLRLGSVAIRTPKFRLTREMARGNG